MRLLGGGLRKHADHATPAIGSCPVCDAGDSGLQTSALFDCVDGIDYFECSSCGSLFADFEAISRSAAPQVDYRERYWEAELVASKERSFGSSIARVAEVFFYSRIPIETFLDVGTGPGYLLDALAVLMPEHRDMFFGVEPYPPPEPYRTRHPNYVIGGLPSVPVKVSAGSCIEVIEHLRPDQLRSLVADLAEISEPGALYYFNSGQPDFVKHEDRRYLDPFVRGHLVSYSITGLRSVFGPLGFKVMPLPGRRWAFLAEFGSPAFAADTDDVGERLWHAVPENVDRLKHNGFGELMYAMGLESARCYLGSVGASVPAYLKRSLRMKIAMSLGR